MKKRILAALSVVVIIAGLAGCGSTAYSDATAEVPAEAMYSTAEARDVNGYSDYGYNETEKSEYAMEEEAVDEAADPSSVTSDIPTESTPSAQEGQKIIYDGTVDLETLEYDKTVKAIKDKIKQYDGIIGYENESDSNYRWYEVDGGSGTRNMYLEVMIPVEKYDEFTNGVAEAGKVLNKSLNAQNITRDYNDTSVYIESLEKEQTRLLEMMDEATEIADMISIEQRLSEVQTELNTYKSRLSEMDFKVAYSTVDISIREVVEYSQVDSPKITFGQRIANAFTNAWKGFKNFCQDVVIALVYLLPYLIVAAVITVIVILIIRGERKKHPEKAARKAEIKAARKALREERKNARKKVKGVESDKDKTV